MTNSLQADKVLEVACGPGRHSILLSSSFISDNGATLVSQINIPKIGMLICDKWVAQVSGRLDVHTRIPTTPTGVAGSSGTRPAPFTPSVPSYGPGRDPVAGRVDAQAASDAKKRRLEEHRTIF